MLSIFTWFAGSLCRIAYFFDSRRQRGKRRTRGLASYLTAFFYPFERASDSVFVFEIYENIWLYFGQQTSNMYRLHRVETSNVSYRHTFCRVRSSMEVLRIPIKTSFKIHSFSKYQTRKIQIRINLIVKFPEPPPRGKKARYLTAKRKETQWFAFDTSPGIIDRMFAKYGVFFRVGMNVRLFSAGPHEHAGESTGRSRYKCVCGRSHVETTLYCTKSAEPVTA